LDKEGKPRPQTAAGWFEPLAKNHTRSGIRAGHTTPVALRHVPLII